MLRTSGVRAATALSPLARQALVQGAPVMYHVARRLMHTIDVSGWVSKNVTPYEGNADFLAPATDRTKNVWKKCRELLDQEIKNGVLDVDPKTVSGITSHAAGYIDKDSEVIVGLQTDGPLKRGIKPYGGISMVKQACEAYGYTLDPQVIDIFTKYRKTHNAGVFDVYSEEMRKARSNGIVTGLPDAYGRGRIIGDSRRVALYGIDQLIQWKREDKKELDKKPKLDDTIRLAEEISEQIKALEELKELGKIYGGFDLARPAQNAREAIQWLYFGYLAAIKQQDGAAMSIGRIDSFLDTYIEKDLKEGRLTESKAQEMIDDFVIKLRLVRHLRTPEYNDLFAGDPTWVTLSLAGTDACRRPLVTKTTFRFLQTLYNLGPAPEPNITVLWAQNLPQGFKEFCAKASVDTSSVQYENDDQMRKHYGTDYGIACCVSGMAMGKQMQFFGARCNLAKLLLYSMNGGKDEVTGKQVGPKFIAPTDGPLKYDQVMKNYDTAMDWMAELYVNTMNCIHYMHDKYCYESIQMALHDSNVDRLMAFGVAGLSVVADSLSAIKYAQVTPVRDPKTGITTAFDIKGDFPKYGNDDLRVDAIASEVVQKFSDKLKQHPTYRNAKHTLSVLTITSNVVYGRKTGSTPDGRIKGEAFAPGANPMHGRDTQGALASLNSVAQLPYDACLDGISNTFSIVPTTLGKTSEDRLKNLSALLDGYFEKGAHHLNVNVLNRETLEDAMAHPENYPQLTIRVSGYAVNFVRLTPAQQREVIARTFHDSM
eukprot:comp20802_c0_seq2/m.27380 comp20802_c0_seq2/g.27380  ORF comp20802_c0_seq2/g.27380 comp20802_c0_seq2/m.27380 type:complete len:767 (-) comp20802_c0_seq2:443-2743(-)